MSRRDIAQARLAADDRLRRLLDLQLASAGSADDRRTIALAQLKALHTLAREALERAALSRQPPRAATSGERGNT